MSTPRTVHPRYRVLAVVAALFLAAACGDDSTAPVSDPLAGLVNAGRGDTAESPPNETPDGPGSFHGFVKGFTPGVPDTNSTIVPLPEVRVTAYRREGDDTQPRAGAAVATTSSNASGAWTLPTLPGGEYIVTFVPSASSGYRAGWTIGTAWSQSGVEPWLIHLPKAVP